MYNQGVNVNIFILSKYMYVYIYIFFIILYFFKFYNNHSEKFISLGRAGPKYIWHIFQMYSGQNFIHLFLKIIIIILLHK